MQAYQKAAALGYQTDSSFYDLHRASQLNLRLPDFLHYVTGLQRRPCTLSYRLVRGVACDPDTGPVHHSYGWQSAAQSPQSPAHDDDAPDCRSWLRAPVYATGRTTGFYTVTSPVFSLPGSDGRELFVPC